MNHAETLRPVTRSAHESGCFRVALTGELLRNVCRQHGIAFDSLDTDEELARRLAEATRPSAS